MIDPNRSGNPAVREGLQGGFAVGVVVGDMRAGVGAGDAEVGEECPYGFEVIEMPRSAWMLSWSAAIPWVRTASAMKALANGVVSVGATIHPTRSGRRCR